MSFSILAINPGSTSTKFAIYTETAEVWKKGVSHRAEDLARFRRIQDQLDLRKGAVLEGIRESGFALSDISAIVGRGGLLKPLEGGVYEVNEQMKADLIAGRYGTMPPIWARSSRIPSRPDRESKAYVVDPVVVDELDPIARRSGIPEIPRSSIFHALNQTGHREESGGQHRQAVRGLHPDRRAHGRGDFHRHRM